MSSSHWPIYNKLYPGWHGGSSRPGGSSHHGHSDRRLIWYDIVSNGEQHCLDLADWTFCGSGNACMEGCGCVLCIYLVCRPGVGCGNVTVRTHRWSQTVGGGPPLCSGYWQETEEVCRRHTDRDQWHGMGGYSDICAGSRALWSLLLTDLPLIMWSLTAL